MSTISVINGKAIGAEWAADRQAGSDAARQEPAQDGHVRRLMQVATSVGAALRHTLEHWGASEAEMRDMGALNGERSEAIVSLAMSGELPFSS